MAERGGWARSLLPLVTVIGLIIAVWYGAAVALNAPWARDQAARAGEVLGPGDLVAATMDQPRPVLPAPHQVVAELVATTLGQPVTSKRSLVHHAGVTLSAALLGFALGCLGGVGLAIAIVHSPALRLGALPWVVASQTVPILALAPMIILVLNAVGLSGLLPKAVISAYLTFFPITVGVVQGLMSPGLLERDLMRSWSAGPAQVFWHLRWPTAVPHLFAAMKVGIGAAVVGAIVGELPTGAVAGLGARLLAGSYYGQTVQIWAALIMAAVVSAALVGLVGVAHRMVLARRGQA